MSKQNREHVGAMLRHVREEARLAQAELATLLGLSSRTLSQWELGRVTPSRSQSMLLVATLRGRVPAMLLYQLATALGVANEVAGVAAPPADERRIVVTAGELRAKMEAALFVVAEDTDAPARALRRAVASVLEVVAASGASVDDARAAIAKVESKKR